MLLGALDVGAARVGVVVVQQRLEDHVERHPVRDQQVRIELNLVGLELAAVRVHLDDAGRRAQPERDLPVENAAQIHRRVAVATHLELVDLTQSRADRSQRRCAVTVRDQLARLRKPLHHQAAREVDVGRLLGVGEDGDGGRYPEQNTKIYVVKNYNSRMHNNLHGNWCIEAARVGYASSESRKALNGGRMAKTKRTLRLPPGDREEEAPRREPQRTGGRR